MTVGAVFGVTTCGASQGPSHQQGLAMSKQFTSKSLNIYFVKLVLVLKISASYSCGWYLQDNWIAHQDDFNQLLAELNSCHGQGETGRFMLGSIRCWKLSRVSILCLKKVPVCDANNIFGKIENIFFFFPKITGSQRMCCYPWPWICGSQWISFALRTRKKTKC